MGKVEASLLTLLTLLPLPPTLAHELPPQGYLDDSLEPPPDPNPLEGDFFGPLPTSVTVELVIKYDNRLLAEFLGSHETAERYARRVVLKAAPKLAAFTPPVKLKVLVVEHLDRQVATDISTAIISMVEERNQAGEHQRTAVLTGFLDYPLKGVALRGTACRRDGYALSITSRLASAEQTAKTFAHEIVHTLGVRHDFDSLHGGRRGHCRQTFGLMSFGESRPNTWTSCSAKDFDDWFRSQGFSCLSPSTTQARTPAKEWSSWGVWGQCSAACDGGERRRSRRCTSATGEAQAEELEFAKDCEASETGGCREECPGEGEELQACNLHSCAGLFLQF